MNRKAFTIVEMAVVLVVISLLTSSVFVAQDLIRVSKVTKVVSDINIIKNAVEQFQLKYSALPGDIADTTISITGVGAGNGNGVIDNNENVLFWNHLIRARMYPGNFSGLIAHQYITTNNLSAANPIAGVPGGPLENSGYRVLSNSNGLLISFDKYSSSSNTLGILTPSEAQDIDKKIDDGLPNTGKVVAFDGTDYAANSCITLSGEYNVSNTNTTCRLGFYVDTNSVGSATSQTCTGGYPVGSVRQSSTQACPSGYVGKIMEQCVLNSGGVAAWQVTKNTCVPVKCGYGLESGDTIDLPCPSGWVEDASNRKIRLTCQSNGYLSIDNYCQIDGSQRCRVSDGGYARTSRNLHCPIGTSPDNCIIVESCATTSCPTPPCTGTGGNWETLPLVGRNNLTCSGGESIGNNSATSTSSCSLSGSTSYNMVGGGQIYNSCMLSTPNNSYTTYGLQQQSFCLPTYTGAGCTPGVTTRDIGCPTGYTGSHIQVCVSSGYYITTEDNCVAINCGGEPVGAIRVAKDKNARCNQDKDGIVYEVCQPDGTWQLHNLCSANYCPNNELADQNSGWALYNTSYNFATPANDNRANRVTSINNIANCAAPYNNNYTNSNTTAARRCGFDGRWQSRNGSCVATPCNALAYTNTTDDRLGGFANLRYYLAFPLTDSAEHGTYNIVRVTAPGNSSPTPTGEGGCAINADTFYPYERKIVTSATPDYVYTICNPLGVWVDFCSDEAIAGLNNHNNRIAAVNALSTNSTSGLTGTIMNGAGTRYIHYYSSSAYDVNNDLVCDVAGDPPAANISPSYTTTPSTSTGGATGTKCAACHPTDNICFY